MPTGGSAHPLRKRCELALKALPPLLFFPASSTSWTKVAENLPIPAIQVSLCTKSDTYRERSMQITLHSTQIVNLCSANEHRFCCESRQNV